MPVATTTVLLGLGLALSAAGTAVSYVGAQAAASAQQRSEALRKQQMDLDIMRRKREAIRQAQLARSTGQAAATAQGVNSTDSSVIGSNSQQTSNQNANITALNQNAELGVGLFKANADLASAQGTQALGGAVSSWGSGLISNAQTIAKVGSSFNLWAPEAGLA
jgi:hypothetical protein